jgi:hypothetical protein
MVREIKKAFRPSTVLISNNSIISARWKKLSTPPYHMGTIPKIFSAGRSGLNYCSRIAAKIKTRTFPPKEKYAEDKRGISIIVVVGYH